MSHPDDRNSRQSKTLEQAPVEKVFNFFGTCSVQEACMTGYAAPSRDAVPSGETPDAARGPKRFDARVDLMLEHDEAKPGLAYRFFPGLLIVSVVAGLSLGYFSGTHTGVHPALEAGARVSAANLAQALPWKSEVYGEAGGAPLAQLLEETRALRAQLEQIRHSAENARVSERLHSLEAGQEAARASERGGAAETGARLEALEARLARLELALADRTPVGALAAKPAALKTVPAAGGGAPPGRQANLSGKRKARRSRLAD
jgi:hypothetical protein